jgi:hypothetical protein
LRQSGPTVLGSPPGAEAAAKVICGACWIKLYPNDHRIDSPKYGSIFPELSRNRKAAKRFTVLPVIPLMTTWMDSSRIGWLPLLNWTLIPPTIAKVLGTVPLKKSVRF